MTQWALILLFQIPMLVFQGGLADEEARIVAVREARVALKLSEHQFLNARRREDLEDEFFAVQSKVRGQVYKGLMFFEISRDGYEVKDGHFSVFTSNDGYNSWIVAVSTKTSKAYAFLGSGGRVSFTQMTAEVGVYIADESGAEKWSLLYLQLVYPPQRYKPIRDMLTAKHAAESYFHSQYDTRLAERKAVEWWKKFSGKVAPKTLSPSVKVQGGKFYVSSLRLALTPKAIPVLERVNLAFDQDGRCEGVSVEQIGLE